MNLVLYISIIAIAIGLLLCIYVIFDHLHRRREKGNHKIIVIITGITACGLVLYCGCMLIKKISDFDKQNILHGGKMIMKNVSEKEFKNK